MLLRTYATALMLFVAAPIHASNLLTTDKIATSVGVKNNKEYKAMDVIKEFREFYATEKKNPGNIVLLNKQWSHYIGFGKLKVSDGVYSPLFG
jgi:hypothetical protein